MIQKVERYIQEHQLLQSNAKVCVALSGGADSVALLLVLHELGYRITALHCNFHLRGSESDRDETFCRTLCQKYDITCKFRSFDTHAYAHAYHISIEMAARDLRYAWFKEEISETQSEAVAVAHHRDDQAETLLLNLIRGTGLRGLSGMKPRNGSVIRPLLCVGKQEVLDFLTKQRQDFVTDSTNLERDAQRNIVRLDVLPLLHSLNAKATENLANLAHIIQEALPYYHQGIEQSNQQWGITETRFPQIVQSSTLLHEWLKQKGFNRTQEQEMLEKAEKASGKRWISETHEVLVDRGTLILRTKNSTTDTLTFQQEEVATMEEKGPQIAYLDADKLTGPLVQRPVKQGDRFVPFGMRGFKLVSDFLTDLKRDCFQKQNQQVVCCGNEIVWVMGERSDNRFRVTNKTKRILKLTLRK